VLSRFEIGEIGGGKRIYQYLSGNRLLPARLRA
jgi:hypothetical protein